ncbi:hypothetical protein ElyMa_005877100 [Elysia marginata]|uniref:Coat protein n=1 Tax=Elysia marginata TaxID=1093978 RepID=A0AAV4G1C4_9GAST|nr:hypothetical protein ElyMa_005877100 [Elysia marginata]
MSMKTRRKKNKPKSRRTRVILVQQRQRRIRGSPRGNYPNRVVSNTGNEASEAKERTPAEETHYPVTHGPSLAYNNPHPNGMGKNTYRAIPSQNFGMDFVTLVEFNACRSRLVMWYSRQMGGKQLYDITKMPWHFVRFLPFNVFFVK